VSTGNESVLEIPFRSGSVPPLVFRRIPAGVYTMGSANGLPHAPEGPEHIVEISEFWMADSPITVPQYQAVMGHNPSRFDGTDLPVDSVNWVEACEFCSKISESGGKFVRLPSEAEWEYACRAGSTTQYHFGDSSAELPAFAWYESNSGGHTNPVRHKKPNAWGLYDIIGNVWEWCLDSWHVDYTCAPCDGSPWRNTSDRRRPYCVRGGAWDMDAFRCRSSYRSYDWEEIGTSRNGFRVAFHG
jgi:formylglycine-generating enzyme required for sulfatase activity